jgi:hypothetical protein
MALRIRTGAVALAGLLTVTPVLATACRGGGENDQQQQESPGDSGDQGGGEGLGLSGVPPTQLAGASQSAVATLGSGAPGGHKSRGSSNGQSAAAWTSTRVPTRSGFASELAPRFSAQPARP